MNHRDLARLLVKIAALVIIASALIDLPDSLARLWVRGAGGKTALEILGASFAPVSISIIAGLVMFWWAGPLVDRTLVKPLAENPVGNFDLRAFEEMAVTLLGLYVVTAGLGEVAYYGGKWLVDIDLEKRRGLTETFILPADLGGLFAGVTRVVFGIVLVLCSRGFVAFKRRFLALRVAQPQGAIPVPIGDHEN